MLKRYKIDIWFVGNFLSIQYFSYCPKLAIYLLHIIYPIRLYSITVIEKPKNYTK